MRSMLASFFRLLFQVSFFRKRYFGIYQKILFPYNLFKDVRKHYRFRNGILFDLHIDDWIQQNLYLMDKYESGELDLVQQTLKEGQVFLDIGANIGLYTLYAASLAGRTGTVIAFEPFTENFQRLQHNVSVNPFQNIRLENMAVAAKATQISLNYDPREANKGMASSYVPASYQQETVNAISLDLYFDTHPINRIDFIKMDIEGGEYPALLGMRDTLLRYGPVILIELNKELLAATPYNEQLILNFLQTLGYERWDWNTGGQQSENAFFRRKTS